MNKIKGPKPLERFQRYPDFWRAMRSSVESFSPALKRSKISFASFLPDSSTFFFLTLFFLFLNAWIALYLLAICVRGSCQDDQM